MAERGRSKISIKAFLFGQSNENLDTDYYWVITTHLFTDTCAPINTNRSQIKGLAELFALTENLKSKLSGGCHYDTC